MTDDAELAKRYRNTGGRTPNADERAAVRSALQEGARMTDDGRADRKLAETPEGSVWESYVGQRVVKVTRDRYYVGGSGIVTYRFVDAAEGTPELTLNVWEFLSDYRRIDVRR